MSAFDDLKQCCLTQGNLDLEAWDVLLFEPLRDFSKWWDKQTAEMHKVVAALAGLATAAVAKGALAKFLEKLLKLSTAEIAGLFAAAILGVLVELTLVTMMHVVSVCIGELPTP